MSLCTCNLITHLRSLICLRVGVKNNTVSSTQNNDRSSSSQSLQDKNSRKFRSANSKFFVPESVDERKKGEANAVGSKGRVHFLRVS